MANKSKAKGNRFERQFVNWLKSLAYSAQRAWGSNGAALGMDESVDVLTEHPFVPGEEVACQLKCRAKIPNYLKIPRACDVVVFKEDYGDELVLMPAKYFWRERDGGEGVVGPGVASGDG